MLRFWHGVLHVRSLCGRERRGDDELLFLVTAGKRRGILTAIKARGSSFILSACIAGALAHFPPVSFRLFLTSRLPRLGSLVSAILYLPVMQLPARIMILVIAFR